MAMASLLLTITSGLIRSLAGKAEKELSSDVKGLADLDILLTDAFLTLSCHLSGGCVNPVTIETEWFAKRRNVDVSSLLEQALRKKQVQETLLKLRPQQGFTADSSRPLRIPGPLSKVDWPLVSHGPA
jgi:hypothetical protein